METKPLDVLAILKLYEVRGEALMREARAWFFTEFAPRSGKEIVRLMLSGERQSAFYRMVTSHWETAASFVNNGGIDERLFLEGNSEHVVVYAKLQPFIEELRAVPGIPPYLYLKHVEPVVLLMPDAKERVAAMQRYMESRRKPGAGEGA